MMLDYSFLIDLFIVSFLYITTGLLAFAPHRTNAYPNPNPKPNRP